jgi:hypothetical protein
MSRKVIRSRLACVILLLVVVCLVYASTAYAGSASFNFGFRNYANLAQHYSNYAGCTANSSCPSSPSERWYLTLYHEYNNWPDEAIWSRVYTAGDTAYATLSYGSTFNHYWKFSKSTSNNYYVNVWGTESW